MARVAINAESGVSLVGLLPVLPEPTRRAQRNRAVGGQVDPPVALCSGQQSPPWLVGWNASEYNRLEEEYGMEKRKELG